MGLIGGFELGAETVLSEAAVGSDGGIVAGTDGVVISIPPGAHPEVTRYRLSSRPITNHALPDELEAASALYRVDNGGVVAELAVEVDVPISIPDGEFAMGFFYDPATGGFEAMSLVDIDGDSVTVATRHFSEFVILWHEGMAVGHLPAPSIDTGFRPGVDDWQFVNSGSAAEPDGHCSGQSLSALWYFTEQRAAGQPALHGLFDNTDADPLNRIWPQTGALWQDDRDGYRLATQVQVEQYAGGMSAYESGMLIHARDLHFSGRDGVTYSVFGLAMMVTGEPQFVGIDEWVDNGDGVWTFADDYQGGHAMVVYGATESGLYVADPNYPARFRMIPWDPAATVSSPIATSSTTTGPGGVLGPYDSAAKAGAPGTSFNVIVFSAKSALVDWDDLGGAWADFTAGTAGDAVLPGYGLEARYTDADGNTRSRGFGDSLVVAVETLELTVDVAGEDWRLEVYDGDTLLGAAEKGATETVPISLDDGANDLGVYVSVKRPDGSSQGWFWAFVDFDRITITRGTGLALDMLPDESEVAGLSLLVKDPPAFRENPDVPGEIIGITAGYKAGPVEVFRNQPGAIPHVEGWVVFEPDPADVCLGTGFGGAAGGFGRNLCIGVTLSLWDGDPTAFDVTAVATEDLPTGALPPTMPAYVPCLVYQPPADMPAFNTATQFPCVEDFTGNVDDGVEIYGWISEDRNLGLQHYRVRAVVEGVRIDVGTSYRDTQTSDVSSARMRDVVSALVNEIARKIRVELGA